MLFEEEGTITMLILKIRKLRHRTIKQLLKTTLPKSKEVRIWIQAYLTQSILKHESKILKL